MIRSFAAVLVLFAGSAAVADDMVDNPEFPLWAKHKPGTKVTLRTLTDANGMMNESIITNTLVSVGENKHVVETVVTSKFNGMEFKAPPSKRDIEKKITLPKGIKAENFGKKPEGTIEEGTETIKVAGGEFKAKWFKTKVENNGVKLEGKMWISEEVPGQILKSETNIGGPTPIKTVIELIEFKKP